MPSAHKWANEAAKSIYLLCVDKGGLWGSERCLQLIKMLAFGVFGELAYMADTWNRLDCFIVLSGIVEYILQVHFAPHRKALS